MGTFRGCTCGPADGDLPAQLLEMTIDASDLDPETIGFHAGYELTSWRAELLAGHIVEWVLDYALRPAEREHLSTGRAIAVSKRAIRAAFGNGKDRGVPGEILLHAVCRQFFGSSTVINKVYFKTADSDTYKGFDAVHCVHGSDGELELWLGEAKFYKSATKAIRAVAKDFDDHLAAKYLRAEFALVAQKIDESHVHAKELKKLIHQNTSLDEVFARVVVPVFIAYDSPVVGAHSKDCLEFESDLDGEVRKLSEDLRAALGDDLPVTVRAFFLPMNDKARLLASLDSELASWI